MRKIHFLSFIIPVLLYISYCTPIVIDERRNESVGTIFINEFMASNASKGMDPYYKNYYDWIEIYNDSDRLIDISNHYLTDNVNRPKKWPLYDGVYIEPKGYFIFYPSGDDEMYDHTNFKLSKDGEEIALFNSVGVLVDYVKFGPQRTDVSYGRKPDGSPNWYYFFEPSMLAPNISKEVSKFQTASPPEFSIIGGCYNTSQTLELISKSSGTPQYKIKYTIDGSFPTETSTTYSNPIEINSTIVIQARTFIDRYLPSPSVCNTFIINENITLPIISISTDPKVFFDEDTGIYVMGNNALPDYPYYGANFWEEWERLVNIEYINESGIQSLNILAGLKIYGGTSVALAQKSFSLYARDKYGVIYIGYKFFDNKNLYKFKRIILRNSGQDWSDTLIRDGFMQSLLIGRMDIDYQSYKPSIIFLNGNYWGIQNIREKMDDNYIETNYGIDNSEIDLLSHFDNEVQILRGDKIHYDSMLDFLKTNDISRNDNYDYIKTKMDVDEYINYYIAQVFFASSDWPGGNLKLWRQRSDLGKWRWMLFDTDYGFGLYGSYHKDMIKLILEKDGIDWPNPAFSTYLFIRLLDNSDFKNSFLQRISAHLNTSFTIERVQNAIDMIINKVKPEMGRQIEKWGGTEGWHVPFPQSLIDWENNVLVMKKFAERRPFYVREHVIEHFGLKGTYELTFNIYPQEGGQVSANTVLLPVGTSTGIYFIDISINLKAIPNEDYELVKWEGISGTDMESFSESIKINLGTNSKINVIFKKKQ